MADPYSVGVAALAGLASGVVGSLVAPWVHWRIETKRMRVSAQRVLIFEARALLSTPPTIENFRKHPIYQQLRPHLSELAIAAVESKQVTVTMRGSGPNEVNAYYLAVLRDLSIMEQRWELL